MKKIVFFDFDGVIVDSFAFCFKIVEAREYITEAEYRKRFEGNIFAAERKLKDPSSTLASFFEDHYRPEIMKCEPVKGISLAIKELAQMHTLVIISSSETAIIWDYLKMAGLDGYFALVLGMDVDRSKVNKINSSLKKYKTEAKDAVFVTDTLGDIHEADKCGVRCIAVAGGFHSEETLRQGNPLAVVKSGDELVREVGRVLE